MSDSSVSRYIARILPLLEANGRATMRMPDPGKKHRRGLDELLQAIPELNVVIDTFEQRVQRPRDRVEADTYYSGKQKRHTLKSQSAAYQRATTWETPASRRSPRSGDRGVIATDPRTGMRLVPLNQPESRYKTGQRVKHASFGEGIVIESRGAGDDEEVTVAFEAVGLKRLVASMANLQLLKG